MVRVPAAAGRTVGRAGADTIASVFRSESTLAIRTSMRSTAREVSEDVAGDDVRRGTSVGIGRPGDGLHAHIARVANAVVAHP